jgi:3-hydroxybutyryl-CoA dehydrogenase
VKVAEIDTVCFIGAGTMGCFNALMAGAAGYHAVIFDISNNALSNVPTLLQEMADGLLEVGFFTQQQIELAQSAISVQANLSIALANAQLVSESVSERLDIKREVHRELDELCAQHVIITSNTSKLLVSDIETSMANKHRFAAMHTHLGSRLIDIVAGSNTSPQTMSQLKQYVQSINGYPLVLSKEYPGYVFNAMLGPVLATAKALVIERVASKEDVDRAWMLHQKLAIGPFGLMDLFGLNIIFDSWQDPKPENAALQDKILNFISPYIEQNKLGVKSGEGFYEYPNPAFKHPSFLISNEHTEFLQQTLICTLVVNAIVVAANDVASIEDIDRAWMISMTVCQGPFGILDSMGIDSFLALFDDLIALGFFSQSDQQRQVQFYLQKYITAQTLGEKSGSGFYQYPDPYYLQDNFLVDCS